jgi:hypothetical protein
MRNRDLQSRVTRFPICRNGPVLRSINHNAQLTTFPRAGHRLLFRYCRERVRSVMGVPDGLRPYRFGNNRFVVFGGAVARAQFRELRA